MVSKNKCPVCGCRKWVPCGIFDPRFSGDGVKAFTATPILLVVDARIGPTNVDFCANCETGVSSDNFLGDPTAPMHHTIIEESP